jgi:hypothetical protein
MQVQILPGSPFWFVLEHDLGRWSACPCSRRQIPCSAGRGNRRKSMRSLSKYRRGVGKGPEKMFSLRFSLFSGKDSLFSKTAFVSLSRRAQSPALIAFRKPHLAISHQPKLHLAG